MIIITKIMDMHKNHNFFVFVYTIVSGMKLMQPFEPIFLTTTLLMGGPARDAGRAC